MIPNTVGTDSTMEFFVGGTASSKKTLTITEGEPKVEILESGTANTALKFHKTSAMSSLSLYQQHDPPEPKIQDSTSLTVEGNLFPQGHSGDWRYS